MLRCIIIAAMERAMSFLWSVLYLIAVALVAAALQTGAIYAGDGFFMAASIMAVFTGHWVVALDTPREAPVATTRFAGASVNYLIALGLVGLITVQAIAVI
jgi:hypothetical protein